MPPKVVVDTTFPAYPVSFASGGVHSPVDATTVYLAALPTVVPIVGNSSTYSKPFLRSGYVRRLALQVWTLGTLAGAADTASVWLRINDTTDYLIASDVVYTAARLDRGQIWDLDEIPVLIAGTMIIKVTYPTFTSTKPTIVEYTGSLWVESQ